MSTKVPGSRATFHLTEISETLPVERIHPKTKKDKLVHVLAFEGQGGGGGADDPWFFGFPKEIASESVNCMKISLRWHLTNNSEGLHPYYYILKKMSYASISEFD